MPADVILSVGVVWREDDEEEENFELESLEGKDSIQLRNLIIIVVVLHGMAKPRRRSICSRETSLRVISTTTHLTL